MTGPAGVTEVSAYLKKSGQVTFDATGNGVLTFDPDNGHQRWVVTSVVVSTNQNATATVIPVATLAINTVSLATMSPGNQRGATWSGNQDVFGGQMDVGPCDFLTVLWSPPPGQSGVSLVGVTGTAVVTGTKYTRRA